MVSPFNLSQADWEWLLSKVMICLTFAYNMCFVVEGSVKVIFYLLKMKNGFDNDL